MLALLTLLMLVHFLQVWLLAATRSHVKEGARLPAVDPTSPHSPKLLQALAAGSITTLLGCTAASCFSPKTH